MNYKSSLGARAEYAAMKRQHLVQDPIAAGIWYINKIANRLHDSDKYLAAWVTVNTL